MTERRSRQSFLGEQSDQVLLDATIGIVGLCGGGSHIAQQAAHVGVGGFLVADFDHVEASNLNRMVGSHPNDAENGILKTAVIERTIKDIKPDARIAKVNGRWQTGELLFRDCTAIVGCVDSYAARDELERFCRRYLIPYIDVGMDVHEVNGGFAISGQVIVSLPGAPCMRCMGFLTDERLAEEQRRYGAAGGRPQVIWPNGVLASAAIGQLMAILLPWHKDLRPRSMLEYDGNRQTLKESSKLLVLEKISCSHFPVQNSLGDPFYSPRLS